MNQLHPKASQNKFTQFSGGFVKSDQDIICGVSADICEKSPVPIVTIVNRPLSFKSLAFARLLELDQSGGTSGRNIIV